LTQGIRGHDTQYDATYMALYGNANPYAFCYGYVAMVLWFLGYPDQALRGMEEVLKYATELASLLTLAGARGFAPLVYHCCRQGGRVQEQGEAGIAVATQMGFPFWRAIGRFWRGWGLAEQGHYKEGIQQMQQGLRAQRETGSSVHQVHFSVLLAEAYGRAGHCEEGSHRLAEAETQMEKTDERFYEAELWRIKGELTLAGAGGLRLGIGSTSPQASSLKLIDPSGVEREVEEYFHKAIDIARQQQAKSLELRAVMSLVRLRQQRLMGNGSRNTDQVTSTALAEEHSMLAEVYGWFTEGFETKDLQEAKVLLNELAVNSPSLRSETLR